MPDKKHFNTNKVVQLLGCTIFFFLSPSPSFRKKSLQQAQQASPHLRSFSVSVLLHETKNHLLGRLQTLAAERSICPLIFAAIGRHNVSEKKTADFEKYLSAICFSVFLCCVPFTKKLLAYLFLQMYNKWLEQPSNSLFSQVAK